MKPKAKNAEWDDSTRHYEHDEWYDAQWEFEEYEVSKGKKTDPNPKPNQKHVHAGQLTSYSP